MRFVLAGGGTGGHVFPGLALSEVFRSRGYEVDFLSDRRAEDYLTGEIANLTMLNVKHISRKGAIPLISFAMRLLLAIVQSTAFLWNRRPDLVVGLGGFVSFPPLLAARLLSIRTAVLEQNSVPGLVTRFFAPRVRQVHLTYRESTRYLPAGGRVRISGNPVRESIIRADRGASRTALGIASDEPAVAVMGGSQGAHRLNLAVAEWLRSGANPLGIRFLVLTGKKDFDLVEGSAGRFEPAPFIRPFDKRIGLVLAACDLVVSRAGATAVAEITARGLPAIFVPYPYATDDHQRSNVEHLRAAGACRVIDDNDLSGERLSSEVESLIKDRESLKKLAEGSRTAGRPDAARVVAESLEELVKGGKS